MEPISKPEIELNYDRISEPISQELLDNIKEAMQLPVPDQNSFWQLEEKATSENKKRIRLLKKRISKEDLINSLKREVIQSPGNTRAKINKLLKRYPGDGLLYFFSALCTYNLTLNSSNQFQARHGFMKATKDAAVSLLKEQISIHTIEQFIRIYFSYLERHRLFQLKVYEEVTKEMRLYEDRKRLMNKMLIIDELMSKKELIQQVLNQLKKRIKPGIFDMNFKYEIIAEAANQIAGGNKSEKFKIGTASEIIAYVQAITSAFARIPILSPVIDRIINQFPNNDDSFLLRKISVNSSRNLVNFRLAAVEGNKGKMNDICMSLLKDNTAGIVKQEGHALRHQFETDPFFNMAYLAELSLGLFDEEDHQEIVTQAIEAMEAVMSRDMSKNHVFTEAANTLSHKLGLLKVSTNLKTQ